MSIRLLTADEIECRPQSISAKGCVLLLYKDARTDMALLDETFGNGNWQRSHEVINGNLFCNIDVWDKEKSCWVRKQDVGVESNTEKEKGQASDAFKRAGFNVGIGRELYTAPFIWINLNADEIDNRNNKTNLKSGVKFYVKSIKYNDQRAISDLVIVDDKGKERYAMSKKVSQPEPAAPPKNSDLAQALEALKVCKDVSSLEELWNTFPELWRNRQFVDAIKKEKLKYEKQPA